jgi:hypothetical protein
MRSQGSRLPVHLHVRHPESKNKVSTIGLGQGTWIDKLLFVRAHLYLDEDQSY